jgi:hypothetical protein
MDACADPSGILDIQSQIQIENAMTTPAAAR